MLAESNLVKGDLLEILASWTEEQTENKLKSKIALSCLELLVPLTWPLEIEEEKFTVNHHRHLPYLRLAQVDYKRAILQHDAAQILKTVARIALPSMAIEMKERSPREDGIIRLVLYFFRNLAMISQPKNLPADVDEAEISRSTTIDAFHSQLAFDVVLAMSSSMGDQFAVQDVVILEVLFYLLKGIDPDRLFLDDQDLLIKKGDDLRELMQKEKTLLGGYKRYAASRHNRFGTMVWIKRDDNRVSTVTGQSVISGPDKDGLIQMDKSKKWNKPKYNGRTTVEPDPTSEFDNSVPLSATARRHLRQFIEKFMDSAFNPLFAHIRKAIEREAERVLHQHPMQFFYLTSWFLQAESARRQRAVQQREQKGKAKEGAPDAPAVESFSLIASVLNQETFILVNRFMQRSIDDKDWQQLNAGMKCFTRILLTIQDMSESPYEDDQEIAENIQNRIFYEESTHDRVVSIVRNYKDQGFGYLDACTELAHIFIRMLERYSKENLDMQIRSKRRARKKKRQQQQPAADGSTNSDAHDNVSEGEDRREAETVSRERKFDFNRFQSRFMSQACVDTFIAFLRFYNDLSTEQLKRVHRYLYRVAFKNELSTVLFRVDIVQLLHKMIKGPEGLNPDLACFKEWEELSRNIFKRLIKRLSNRPELMVEMLFSKIPATTYYLEHGHDKTMPARVAKPATEWELQADVDRDKGIGAIVGLLNIEDKPDLAMWVKSELERAYNARKAWVDMQEARATTGGQASDGYETPPYCTFKLVSSSRSFANIFAVIKPDSKEIEKAIFKNGKLRLLMSLVGFERLGIDDGPKASYIIRPSVTMEELQHAKELVEGFIETPQEYDDDMSHEDLISRKSTHDTQPRQAGMFDDDDSSGGEGDYDEGATLFPPGGPTSRKSDALEELKKRRRKRKDGTQLDDEDKSKKAEARKQANLEKIRKIKSDVFVHSSDEEPDEERDREFFAMEEKRHKTAVSKMRQTISRLAEKPAGPNGRKRKSRDEDDEEESKRRRSSSPYAVSWSDNDLGKLIEISSDPSSSGSEMEANNESGGEEQETPLSSQHLLLPDGEDGMGGRERLGGKPREATATGADMDEDMDDVPVRKVQVGRRARAGFLIDSDSE